jgi:hypothetical protein
VLTVKDTGGNIAAGINNTGSKICHRYQRHPRQILPPVPLVLGVNKTYGKFATGVNNVGGKLPPVSTTQRQICHRCKQHQWQIMGTV